MSIVDDDYTYDTLNIISCYYDRDNGFIYYCTYSGTTFHGHRIDISDDTIDYLGYESYGINQNAVDIFVTDQGVFAIASMSIGGAPFVFSEVWVSEWDETINDNADHFTLVASTSIGPGSKALSMKQGGLVIGDDFYFPLRSSDGDFYIDKYDWSGGSLAVGSSLGNYTHPTTANLYGLSYDGSDVIYGTVSDGGTNKLFAYSITGDSWELLSAYNVSIMWDRNGNDNIFDSNGNYRPECFRLEKGFSISDDDQKRMTVYQIPRDYQGNLNLIANWLRSMPKSTIVAITDSYCIIEKSDNTVQLWEFVDLGPSGESIVIDVNINHPEREFPIAYLKWLKKNTDTDR